ncbi:MAG: choice-of-anchor V domain-containing protein [Bryobacteraceae bacterium]
MRQDLLILLLSASPALLFAESQTASIRFTGVPIDGGQTCVSCHTPRAGANTGSVSIDAGSSYFPGVAQMIHVTVSDPASSRWGFQLTSRVISGEKQEAGNFAPTETSQVRCDDGTQFGTAGPCNGTREFAEHMSAPRTASGAGFTFDVMWTPPANEVGDIRFYASAVAADGDGTTAGDRTYTTGRVLSASGACNATKRPTLQTAINGASFLPPVSANAMLTIKGLDFQVPGRSRSIGLGDFVSGAFPKELACVAVEIAGQRVAITYVQQDQINVQAPALPSSGSVPIIVILNPDRQNELRSDLGMITALQSFAPAFFMLSPSSSIAAQFAGTANVVANPSKYAEGKPAKPGDILTLYATGLGLTNPAVKPGDLAVGAAPITTPITVMIGSVTLSPADVLYAGLSPGSISGLYQINIRVPAGVPSGDVPVTITMGGFTSQPQATIPIALP